MVVIMYRFFSVNDYSEEVKIKKNVLLLLSKVIVKSSIGRLKTTMREVLFSKHLLK
jgi:hypothetical protein